MNPRFAINLRESFSDIKHYSIVCIDVCEILLWNSLRYARKWNDWNVNESNKAVSVNAAFIDPMIDPFYIILRSSSRCNFFIKSIWVLWKIDFNDSTLKRRTACMIRRWSWLKKMFNHVVDFFSIFQTLWYFFLRNIFYLNDENSSSIS